MLGIAGPLIPDESILVFTGIAVHRGQFTLVGAIGAAFAGSLCGITVSYMLGRTGAVYVLRKLPTVSDKLDKYLPQAEAWFAKYGKWTLFFGYFFAGVRHVTALSAGMSRLRFPIFAAWAWPGGLVWVICFILLGKTVGDQWEVVLHQFNRIGLVVLVVAAVAGVGVWLWRRRSRNPN